MRKTYELYFALAGVISVTLVYLPFTWNGLPRASGLVGHGIGILGFILMLATETMYSLRKRMRGQTLGRMSTWLQFHIVTGIVGPYMVLLHTSWKFSGLAGVVMLLTIIIVVSGFIGRYIYTAIPRTADGAEVALDDLQAQIAEADARLLTWSSNRSVAVGALASRWAAVPEGPQGGARLVLGRTFSHLVYQLQLLRETRRLDAEGRRQAAQLRRLVEERRRLQRQIQSLATARRLLAIWHTIPIPLGVALFTMAFIHIGAAIYLATLLK
jgi:hypothetical protein